MTIACARVAEKPILAQGATGQIRKKGSEKGILPVRGGA